MSVYKFFVRIFAVTGVLIIFNISMIYSMKKKQEPKIEAEAERALVQEIVCQFLGGIEEKVKEVQTHAGTGVLRVNEALALAYKSNEASIQAFKMAEEILKKLVGTEANIERMRSAGTDLAHEAEQLSAQLRSDAAEERVKAEQIAERIAAAILSKSTEPLEDKIKVAEAAAKIVACGNIDAAVAAEKERGRWFYSLVSDTKLMIKIVAVIIIIALCIYIIKYGIPALINYFKLPRVVTETSRSGFFQWFGRSKQTDLDDLIFTPSLQKQLFDLLTRIKVAKKYNEALPNILFYGAPGTGKSAFARALAYASGLDYALTSGSEFAKITNLNQANNELRKLLNWAKTSKKGLIIFIDEAESLFANRRLLTTSKSTQDLINTFLSLISEQSQKNVMFILATNHPFKLDDAITNRIGINIEFALPEAPEREKILSMYLVKFAQDNKNATVDLHPEIIKSIPKYAESLKGFSPRAIKFIAEEMISNARRQDPIILTDEMVKASIDQAKKGLQKTVLWSNELDKWAGGLSACYAQK